MKQFTFILVFVFVFVLSSCNQKDSEVDKMPIPAPLPEPEPKVISFTDPVVSFSTERHASEGILFRSKQGRISNIFRFDSTEYANHVGDTSKIVIRELLPTGHFSEVDTLIDNQFDARNISILQMGDITLLQYRNYDVKTPANSRTVYRELYNDRTLGDEIVIINNENVSPSTSPGVELDNGGFISVFYNLNYIELIEFDPQDLSHRSITILDYRWQDDFELVEPVIENLGEGNLIMLARDNSKKKISNPLYSMSHDNGLTWSEFKRTNITDGLFCSAPMIKKIPDSTAVITSCADRRSVVSQGGYNEEVLWVYVNEVDDFKVEEVHFKLVKKVERTIEINNQRFYGYPSIIETGTGALLLYTDNYYDERERAKLYQLEILLEGY